MCHDLECGSGRVHGLVLGVSGSAEMTESAFGVLELSGEAKNPGEGWGGVGGCARGFAEHGWPASASSRKSALLGQHSAPTVAASRNPRFQWYLRRLAMFFKQTPAPWSEHHAHQPCPLDGLGVSRAHVLSRSFRATFWQRPAGPLMRMMRARIISISCTPRNKALIDLLQEAQL